MLEDDVPQYLANVLHVSRADGALSKNEEAAMDRVLESIKGKKRDISKAEKLVSEPSFQMKPVGRFSEQVRNIEDMVFMALANGELADEETAAIVAFAKLIGITQDQIDGIVAEADRRVEHSSDAIPCGSCGANIPAASKFCGECGAPVVTPSPEAEQKLEFDYPTTGIGLEFAESTAATFHAARTIAQSAPIFQECTKGKKKWYFAAWPEGGALETIELVEALKGIRNRKVIVQGQETSWDDVYGFLSCFKDRQKAYRPVEYCFGLEENELNIWGCKQARLDWTNWARWFSYGQYRNKNTFTFDKNRIRHELETNLFKYRFCPCLRTDLVAKSLTLFPDEAYPGHSKDWKYSADYDEGPNSIKVTIKDDDDEYGYSNTFFTDGVRPSGTKIAQEILRQALKACSISDVDVRKLK